MGPQIPLLGSHFESEGGFLGRLVAAFGPNECVLPSVLKGTMELTES